MKRSAALLVVCAAPLACGPAVRSASFTEFPSRPDTQAVPLFGTRLPECPYEEVGLVWVGKGRGFASLEDMVEALRTRAREMGGDAVVGVAQGRTAEAGVVSGNVVTLSSGDESTGTVTRFVDVGRTEVVAPRRGSE